MSARSRRAQVAVLGAVLLARALFLGGNTVEQVEQVSLSGAAFDLIWASNQRP